MNGDDECIHDLVRGQCAECQPAPPTHAEGTCRWCPQPLTDPLSIWLGVGPICFHKDEKAQSTLVFLLRDLPAPPICRRWGPLPKSTANQRRTAFGRLTGVEAYSRQHDDGRYVYLRRLPDEAGGAR